jgi:hypothetical protein
VNINFDEWESHAQSWDREADAARDRLHVDDTAIEEAKKSFGKIGTSSIGQEYAAALQARRELGLRFGSYANGVAGHIRRDLETYGDTEAASSRALST